MKTVRNITLAALAATAFVAPAHAAQYNNYNPATGTGGFGDSNTPGAGAFTSTFTFEVLFEGTLSTYVQNLSAGAVGDIDFTGATLTGGTLGAPETYSFATLPFGGNADGDERGTLFLADIGPGIYTLVVTGSAGSSASFTGDFTVTAAAIPEPASWAMMIGGVGLAGGALRRRSTKVSFA